MNGLPKLIELYNNAEVNQISGFCAVLKHLSATDLSIAYTNLRDTAPHRHNSDKVYFGNRSGITNSGTRSNRREEHLAIALRNAFCGSMPLRLPDEQNLEILDYQTPLKERRDDKGIGKIDLFGVIEGTTPCVIELKVPTITGGPSDTPLRAYLEALAYCAIIEANAGDITDEIAEKANYRITETRPALMLMAPDDYWMSYLNHPKSGDWWPTLQGLAMKLSEELKLASYFIALVDVNYEMGLDGASPELTSKCALTTVSDLANGLGALENKVID